MDQVANLATTSGYYGPVMNPARSVHTFSQCRVFLQLLYSLVFSGQLPSIGSLSDFVTTFWLFFTLISYLICLLLIGMLVYFSTRLHQIEDEDAKRYTTISKDEAHAEVEHSRWSYIRNLSRVPQQSEWRQAIIEADIMLDELLTKSAMLATVLETS